MKSDIERAIEYFRDKVYFTSDELFFFWKAKDQDLNRNAFYQRLHRLKKQSTVKEVYGDYFTFSGKPRFEPPGDYTLHRIARKFKIEYPEIKYCIWKTSWLHNFMIHQPTRSFIVFETEKDVMESVFYLFRDLKRKSFYMTDKTILDYLIMEEEEVILLKPLISRSPTIILQGDVEIPAMEKILVDIYCDANELGHYCGEELQNIYRNSYKMYHLNFTGLLNYAGRRGKKTDILELIKMFTDDSLKKILDDNK